MPIILESITAKSLPDETVELGFPVKQSFSMLDTVGDGNCGLNAITLKILEYAKRDQLALLFRKEHSFLLFITHCLRSLDVLKERVDQPPFVTTFIGFLEQRGKKTAADFTLEEFQAFLKTANTLGKIKQLQRALSPGLRSLLCFLWGNDAYFNQDLVKDGTHLDDQDIVAVAAFFNIKINICQAADYDEAEELYTIVPGLEGDLLDNPIEAVIIHTSSLPRPSTSLAGELDVSSVEITEERPKQDDLHSIAAREGHWVLGLGASDTTSIALWSSMDTSDATIEDLFEHAFEKGRELLLKLSQSKDLKNRLNGKFQAFFDSVQMDVNEAVSDLFDKLDEDRSKPDVELTSNKIDEIIQDAFNRACDSAMEFSLSASGDKALSTLRNKAGFFPLEKKDEKLEEKDGPKQEPLSQLNCH